jgi:hypothetical protein
MNNLLLKTCNYIYIMLSSSTLHSQTTACVKIATGTEYMTLSRMVKVNLYTKVLNSRNKDEIIFQTTGIRFSNLNLPFNTHITITYIQFICDNAFSLPTHTYADRAQIGNTAAFSASPFNLSNRSLLSTSVSWIPAAWTVVGKRDKTHFIKYYRSQC